MSTENKDQNEFSDFSIGGMHYKTHLTKKFINRKKYEEHNPKLIKAFIPGTIIEVFVKNNNKVLEDQPLLILEAMKMRNVVYAPQSGKIKKIWVKAGEMVAKNQLLIEFY